MAWSCQGNQREGAGGVWQFRENKAGKEGQLVSVLGLLGTNASLFMSV